MVNHNSAASGNPPELVRSDYALAEGWATGFIRNVMDNYRIIFVGYAADDPPVQYLLEALSRSAYSNPSRLYAFQPAAQTKQKLSGRKRALPRLPTIQPTDMLRFGTHSARGRNAPGIQQDGSGDFCGEARKVPQRSNPTSGDKSFTRHDRGGRAGHRKVCPPRLLALHFRPDNALRAPDPGKLRGRGFAVHRSASAADSRKHKAWATHERIEWLRQGGCAISEKLDRGAQRLAALLPEAAKEAAVHAADSRDSRGGLVITDTSFGNVDAVPIADLISWAI